MNRFLIQNLFQDRYMKMGKREAETETAGNCLSWPVIFVDGSVDLRGDPGEEKAVLLGEYRLEDPEDPGSERWYLQQDEFNAWQAESHTWNAEPDGILTISETDDIVWGDNLYARAWTTHSMVRVETVLSADFNLMDEFEMKYLEGEGPTEMQGTNGKTKKSSYPTVFTPNAWLTIQRWEPESENLTWDPENKLWIGAEDPIVSGGYSAEINVKGKVIFGYNWFVQRTADPDDGTGLYRITMWLEEGSDAVIDSEDGLGLSYVDVPITDAAAGGGGGGGGNGGDGGGNGGGPNLVADFEAGPLSGSAPLKVYFDDLSTGNPKSWLWEFGDDNTSVKQYTSHIYLLPGNYTVRLTIEKGTKTATETKYEYITVE
jgi:hypothetical protein